MNKNENIKLYHGDCLEIMDKLIKDGVKVDAIITDPPYGKIACKWDIIIPFTEMWVRLKKLRKDKTPILLFGVEPFSSALRMSNIKEFKYDWIWNKNTGTGFSTAKKRPMKYHEIISVFYLKQCLYNPQFQEYSDSSKKRFKQGEKVNRKKQINKSTDSVHGGLSLNKLSGFDFVRGKHPSSVQFFKTPPNANGLRFHPTQKPIALLEYLVKTYTNKNNLVLDFTCGSGTAGVACINLGRRFIGIDNGYCEKKESKFYKKSWIEIADYRIKQSLTLFDK
jgi:site-specific DNA-methyltransferase (adenine-specific)